MVQETRVRLSRESLRHRRAQGQRLENTKVGGLGGYGESSERTERETTEAART